MSRLTNQGKHAPGLVLEASLQKGVPRQRLAEGCDDGPTPFPVEVMTECPTMP
jgi:hypothetical protein